jgi:phosphoribosylaminoimidazole synthetase
MASGGYPGSYRRGHPVTGVERALCVPGTTVFHSGTTVLGERAARALRRSFSGLPQEPPAASQRIVTNGGRVLTVVSVGRGLHEARERAYVGVRAISFNDAWYRHDIAALASLTSSPRRESSCSDIIIVPSTPQASPAGASGLTYRAAGVDRSACQAAVASFEPLALRTVREDSGHESGALWASLRAKVHEVAKDEIPYLLVSSTSAVGTKLRLAAHAKHFDSLGVDLVALCANDVAARGAEPLFFHEHISTNKVDAEQAMQMVRGVAEGCVEAGCTLLDTGVAELPGVFAPGGGSDFVGFAVGRAERGGLLPRHSAMVAGDALIALPSSGLHSNGFSLVRFIIRAAGLDYSQAAPFDPTRSLGDALLTPARIYVQPLLALSREGLLKGAAPVASGGLQRCCDGVLPEHLAARLQADAWEMPAAQRWLAAVGKVKCSELAATFNCGIGMLLVVAAADKERVLQTLRDHHEEPMLVGELGNRKADSLPLEVEGADLAWLMLPELGASLPFPEVLSSLQDPWTISRKKVVVLGGREEVSPLQALVQALALPASAADLSAFVSPYPDSPLLAHARNMGLQAIVLGKGQFASTEFYCEGLDLDAGEDPAPGTGADDGAGQGSSSISADFSRQFDELMTSLAPDFVVVLDDVDRTLLTRQLLQRYMGRVLLIHASLLPAFPGPCPVEAALRAGVCITGCTVSFAAPPSSLGAEHRHGPVILQEATKVHPNDTACTLRARLVAECEAAALPRAVQLVASGSVVLKTDDAGYSLGRSASFAEAANDSDDMFGAGAMACARKAAH